MTTNRYYPSSQKTGALHDDLRLLFDGMYRQQDENAGLRSQLADLKKSHGELSQQIAQGPSNTKIMGIPVTGTPPQDGQKLTYSKAIGGFIFE